MAKIFDFDLIQIKFIYSDNNHTQGSTVLVTIII